MRGFVAGEPAAQGSKRHVGGGVLIEQSRKVGPWRRTVHRVVSVLLTESHAFGRNEPVAIWLDFVMPRPKSTPKRRTPFATKRPDLDKLVRAVLDAITTSAAWSDDSQVVELHATKRLAAEGEVPGVHLRLDTAIDSGLGEVA